MEIVRYYILLALSLEPMHAYAIRSQIVGDGMGRYVSDGTLYRLLGQLVKQGLIGERISDWDGRVIYRLTEAGWKRLRAENGILLRAARLGEARLH